MPLQPSSEVPLTHFEFRTDLIEAVHTIQVLGECLFVNSLVNFGIKTEVRGIARMANTIPIAIIAIAAEITSVRCGWVWRLSASTHTERRRGVGKGSVALAAMVLIVKVVVAVVASRHAGRRVIIINISTSIVIVIVIIIIVTVS